MGPRSRVLSFSMFGAPPGSLPTTSPTFHRDAKPNDMSIDTITPQASTANLNELAKDSPPPTQIQQQRNRSDSQFGRPTSMIQAYQPAQVDAGGDTIPELQPIFSYLNSHTNKLYHEGYFLKLHDLDARGRPSTDRNWTECFAQLVGTVLSLWDAAALDAAGEEGEVLPTFLNLSDASIKMIEELPMHGSAERTLQNVLSISTAANNRYLLHFNSVNSLTQWTAGIRLSMYEHATLQEAYTGSLIAGKGKLLNNIRSILEHSRFVYEDWVRVRFGAGTPWRRCWCTISPPDEKEYQKAHKAAKKKNSYSRKVQIPKGDIKFYETQKVTKKTKPIATITDAYAAYAIYPQSKPLIDQSTLIKLEGLITIHTPQETTSEAFVFVMPETHPGVSGFEMLLRWLFRCYDSLVLYGRPTRLIADVRDQRGLMFAMPTDRRYGYLDDIDVSALIHTEGSQAWTERQWRMELKKCTAHKMDISQPDSERVSPDGRQRARTVSRQSLPSMSRVGGVRFNDGEDSDSSFQDSRRPSPAPGAEGILRNPKRSSADPSNITPPYSPSHNRSVSEAVGLRRAYQPETPTALSHEANAASGDEQHREPASPTYRSGYVSRKAVPKLARVESEYEGPQVPVQQPFEELDINTDRTPVSPVVSPPAFLHNANAKPTTTPYQAPELRRATSEMDTATLAQMKEVNDAEGRENMLGPEHNEQPGGQHEVATGHPHQQQPRGPTDDTGFAGLAERPLVQIPDLLMQPVLKPSPLELKPLSAVAESSIPSTPGTAGIDRDLVNGDALNELLLRGEAEVVPEPNQYDQLASSRPVYERKRTEGQRAGRLRVTGDTNMRPPVSDVNISSGVREALSINFDAPNSTGHVNPDARLHAESSPTNEAFHDAAESISPRGIAVAFGNPEMDLSLKAQPQTDGPSSDNLLSIGPATDALLGSFPDPSPVTTKSRQSQTPEEWMQHQVDLATNAGSPPRANKNRVSSVPTLNTDAKLASPRMLSAGWDKPSPRWSPVMQSQSQPTLIEQADTRRLTAQNRMQAVRIGGAPLLAMNPSDGRSVQRTPSPSSAQGLYGALQARDEWQRTSKNSYQSPATQQAMAAGQYQQAAAQQAQQANQARMQFQNQAAVHAAQMAQYQAFLRQQQAQAHGQMQMPVPMMPPHQQGYMPPQSPGSYRQPQVIPNAQMSAPPPNQRQPSWGNGYPRPGYR